MLEVTTIRTQSGSEERGGGGSPRVEVSTRPAGVLARLGIALAVLAGLCVMVVLAIVLLPLFLIALALIIVWFIVRTRLRFAAAARRAALPDGRENVRVRSAPDTDQPTAGAP